MTGAKPDIGCVFCLAPTATGAAAGDPAPSSQESLIVYRRRTCYVILNLYPYNNGHVMIAPYRHVASLAALTVDEIHEVGDLLQLTERVLMVAYNPQGINAGVNLGKPAGAGVLDHVHVHLVPRWNGDTNFMTVVSDVRVLPEDLATTARKLRPIFERLSVEDKT